MKSSENENESDDDATIKQSSTTQTVSHTSLIDPLFLMETWIQSSPILIELNNVIVEAKEEKELGLPVVEVCCFTRSQNLFLHPYSYIFYLFSFISLR